MTSKEIAIQKVEQKLKEKERKLDELQVEISLLEKKLEECRNIPDSYYETILEYCEDFPLEEYWCYRIACEIGTFKIDGYRYATINDLIHASPEKLLKVRGIGKVKLKLIEEWMEKHELHFIS